MRWLLALLLLCGGCTRNVYTPVRSSVVVVDTVVREVADSAVLRALFECDSNSQVVLRELYSSKGVGGSSDLGLDSSGRIEVVTRWQTKYIDRIEHLHDTTTVVEIREVEKIVRHVPRICWYSIALSVLTILFGGAKLFRLL